MQLEQFPIILPPCFATAGALGLRDDDLAVMDWNCVTL